MTLLLFVMVYLIGALFFGMLWRKHIVPQPRWYELLALMIIWPAIICAAFVATLLDI